MLSCALLAASCEVRDQITTVEGITEHGSLAAIQESLRRLGELPVRILHTGFYDYGHAPAVAGTDPTDADIRSALSSNLCRCTGYNQMYQAVRAAIEAEKKGLAVAG